MHKAHFARETERATALAKRRLCLVCAAGINRWRRRYFVKEEGGRVEEMFAAHPSDYEFLTIQLFSIYRPHNRQPYLPPYPSRCVLGVCFLLLIEVVFVGNHPLVLQIKVYNCVYI